MKTNQENVRKFIGFTSSGICGMACCRQPALFGYGDNAGSEWQTCQEHTPIEVRLQSVSQHAALVAVAEAAKDLANFCQRELRDRRKMYPAKLEEAQAALANLAAVRNK